LASQRLPAKRRCASTKAAMELTSSVKLTVKKAMKAELPNICQNRALVAIDT
jgi:hypothetical protein